MGDCDKDYGNKSSGKGAGPNRLADRNSKRGKESQRPGFALQQLLSGNESQYFRIDRAVEEEWRVVCKAEVAQLVDDRANHIIATDEDMWSTQTTLQLSWLQRRTPWITARIAELEGDWKATGLTRRYNADDFEVTEMPVDPNQEHELDGCKIDFSAGYNQGIRGFAKQMSEKKLTSEQKDQNTKKFNEIWKTHKDRPTVRKLMVKRSLLKAIANRTAAASPTK